MKETRLPRRRFSVGFASTLAVGLAGCGDLGTGDGESDGNSSDGESGGDSNDGEGADNGSDEENSSDGESDGDDETDENDDGPGTLTVNLENQDGEPVSSGVEVTIDLHDDVLSYQYRDGIEEGTIEATPEEEGEYTITGESLEEEFDPVEEEVSLGTEDEEITLTLDGATPDSEREEEGEDE